MDYTELTLKQCVAAGKQIIQQFELKHLEAMELLAANRKLAPHLRKRIKTLQPKSPGHEDMASYKKEKDGLQERLNAVLKGIDLQNGQVEDFEVTLPVLRSRLAILQEEDAAEDARLEAERATEEAAKAAAEEDVADESEIIEVGESVTETGELAEVSDEPTNGAEMAALVVDEASKPSNGHGRRRQRDLALV